MGHRHDSWIVRRPSSLVSRLGSLNRPLQSLVPWWRSLKCGLRSLICWLRSLICGLRSLVSILRPPVTLPAGLIPSTSGWTRVSEIEVGNNRTLSLPGVVTGESIWGTLVSLVANMTRKTRNDLPVTYSHVGNESTLSPAAVVIGGGIVTTIDGIIVVGIIDFKIAHYLERGRTGAAVVVVETAAVTAWVQLAITIRLIRSIRGLHRIDSGWGMK